MNKQEMIANKDVQDCVIKFFEVSDGFRARIRRFGTNSFGYVSDDKNKYGYPLATITKNNVIEELKYNPYFLSYLFSHDAKTCQNKSSIENYAIGITPFMDCDSPYVDKNATPVIRKNCMEKGNEYIIDMFEALRKITRNRLMMYDLWSDVREMSSGNGIYFILGDAYTNNFSEDVNELKDGIHAIYESINMDFVDEYPEESPMVDNRYITWNRFIKCPWTTHVKYPRAAIPLNKNKPITKEILSQSIINNMTPETIVQIIKNSKW